MKKVQVYPNFSRHICQIPWSKTLMTLMWCKNIKVMANEWSMQMLTIVQLRHNDQDFSLCDGKTELSM